jgi:hypothetical protein
MEVCLLSRIKVNTRYGMQVALSTLMEILHAKLFERDGLVMALDRDSDGRPLDTVHLLGEDAPVRAVVALKAERDELRAALMRVGEALSDLEEAGSDPAVLEVVRTAVKGEA